MESKLQKILIIANIVGRKIVPTSEEFDEESESAKAINEKGNYPIHKVVINSNDNSAFRVEITKNSKDYSSIIANEIVGNLKMVGYSFVIGFVFGVFLCYTIKEI